MTTSHRPIPRFILCLLFVLVSVLPTLALAQSPATETGALSVANPGTDLWREVRQREIPASGYSQVQGTDTGVLINPYGETWRKFRMQQLLVYGGYALGGTLLFVIAFYLIRGKVPLQAGPSDKKLPRFTVSERITHWFNAFVFLFLALSGLVMLFGRPVLLPLLGPEIFSVLASASKEGHNLFGPLFILALSLLFFHFVRRNIYQRGDLTWLLKGGGIIGKKHVPSNFFNMGEKSWFWMLMLVGGVTAATGVVLLFPVFGLGREWMELAHAAHTITALSLLMVTIGHIYISTLGMESAIDGMTTGYCDLNWAREHHDWWAQRCEEEGKVVSAAEAAAIHGLGTPPGAPRQGMAEEAGK